MNSSECCTPPVLKTNGEKFEGIAFTFCKTAFIVLLTQKYALPIASGAAALFYALAFANGKRDTRCFLVWTPFIASFWSLVCVVSSYLIYNPAALEQAMDFLLGIYGLKK
ncbi:MAG: hypothetical protein K2X27_02685 [Candidatus Obscuribacterales bacterium]|nr:hypothetical protein [Candidatus Obscuribacterales bacterium]